MSYLRIYAKQDIMRLVLERRNDEESSLMAFSLPMPEPFKQQGWKAKIRDKEVLESPYVTIMRGVKVWRLSLRDGKFMDQGSSWRGIPGEVREEVERNWRLLHTAWDQIYPENPV